MNEPNDNVLDDYLRGNSPVSQRYRELESADVPPHLDAAVLAQARAAVGQSSARKASLSRWRAPLAIAASAVFAIAVVLEIGVQEEVRIPTSVTYQESESHLATEAPEARADVTASEPPPQAQQAQDIEIQAKRAASQASREARARSIEASSERQARAAAPAAPPPAVQRAAAPRPENVVVSGSRIRGTPEDAALPVEVFTLDEPSNTGQPSPIQIDEPFVADLEQERTTATSAASSGATDSIQKAEARTAAPVRASASAPVEGPRLEPEPWLQRIRDLRREGKILEADEQWREFVASYPDYEVERNDLARPSSR